jgi:hypothetical protein
MAFAEENLSIAFVIVQLSHYRGVPLDEPIWVNAHVPVATLLHFHHINKLRNHQKIPTGCAGGGV